MGASEDYASTRRPRPLATVAWTSGRCFDLALVGQDDEVQHRARKHHRARVKLESAPKLLEDARWNRK